MVVRTGRKRVVPFYYDTGTVQVQVRYPYDEACRHEDDCHRNKATSSAALQQVQKQPVHPFFYKSASKRDASPLIHRSCSC